MNDAEAWAFGGGDEGGPPRDCVHTCAEVCGIRWAGKHLPPSDGKPTMEPKRTVIDVHPSAIDGGYIATSNIPGSTPCFGDGRSQAIGRLVYDMAEELGITVNLYS